MKIETLSLQIALTHAEVVVVVDALDLMEDHNVISRSGSLRMCDWIEALRQEIRRLEPGALFRMSIEVKILRELAAAIDLLKNWSEETPNAYADAERDALIGIHSTLKAGGYL